MGNWGPFKCKRCGYWHVLGEPCEGKEAGKLLRDAEGIVRSADAQHNDEQPNDRPGYYWTHEKEPDR